MRKTVLHKELYRGFGNYGKHDLTQPRIVTCKPNK